MMPKSGNFNDTDGLFLLKGPQYFTFYISIHTLKLLSVFVPVAKASYSLETQGWSSLKLEFSSSPVYMQYMRMHIDTKL